MLLAPFSKQDFLRPLFVVTFEQLAPSCRFRNCTHTHEPGCAIIAAVEQGDIKARRYDSYLRILDTLE